MVKIIGISVIPFSKKKRTECERKIANRTKGSLVCVICGQTFTRSDNLNRHVRMHLGQFKCDKCKKGFSDVTHYKKHVKKTRRVKGLKVSLPK